jgi:GNAT superfamily N-acetyltransferase
MQPADLAANINRFQRGMAAEIGCSIDDFRSDALAIVERPEDCWEPYALKIVTFGTGTVISAEPRYLEFVRSIAIEPHFRAFTPAVFLAPFAAECARRAEEITWRGPGLGFVPGGTIETIPIAAGFTLERVGEPWRESHVAARVFANALGEPDDIVAGDLWWFALVLFGPDGEPAAAAGAYRDGLDRLEIGVDVARAHRGMGQAPIVVTAMAAEAESMGLMPSYYCAPTNIRSQRTAWSCGFVPALSHAVARLARNTA